MKCFNKVSILSFFQIKIPLKLIHTVSYVAFYYLFIYFLPSLGFLIPIIRRSWLSLFKHFFFFNFPRCLHHLVPILLGLWSRYPAPIYCVLTRSSDSSFSECLDYVLCPEESLFCQPVRSFFSLRHITVRIRIIFFRKQSIFSRPIFYS